MTSSPSASSEKPAAAPGEALAQSTLGAAWAEAAAGWPELLAGGAELLAVKDAQDGRYLAAGPAAQALFGLAPEAWSGRTDVELFGPALATAWRAADELALGRAEPIVSEHAFEWRAQWREFVVTRHAVRAHGGALRILSHWADVRAERQQARQLAEVRAALRQARDEADALRRAQSSTRELHDPVSGLPGPQPFLEQLRREADLSMREGREMALVLLDIDPGIAVETSGPHSDLQEEALDHAARIVGAWLRAGTRAMDATARLGPTRFGILLSGAGLSIAARRAEAIRAAHAPAADGVGAGEGNQPAAFGLSLGVASYPLSADTPDALMRAAEQAVDRARARGGNQVALAGLTLGTLG
jgi:diguanylate cyclase (GGDEF)-like protein